MGLKGDLYAKTCHTILWGFELMAPTWMITVYGWMPRWISSKVVQLVNPSYLIGVVALVFDDDGRVLILKHTYHEPRWRLPGGLLNRGEQPDQAAVRETKEEACCDICCREFVDAIVLPYSLDIAMLADLHTLHPFAANSEVVERRFISPNEWGMLRPDQQRFVKKGYAVWQERVNKG